MTAPSGGQTTIRVQPAPAAPLTPPWDNGQENVDSMLPGSCHCGHDVAEHDAVGSRYCSATEGGALPRGCICRPTGEPKRS